MAAGTSAMSSPSMSNNQEDRMRRRSLFAAASLKDALDALNADWQKYTGKHATISYGASPALAKQIESGAPADVFISADLDWMDYLGQKNQIAPGSRRNLLGNSLVLIAPADSKVA